MSFILIGHGQSTKFIPAGFSTGRSILEVAVRGFKGEVVGVVTVVDVVVVVSYTRFLITTFAE